MTANNIFGLCCPYFVNVKAVISYLFALAAAVVSMVSAAYFKEPTLLISSILAAIGIAVVLFFSLSKGRNMKIFFPVALSLCLLLSAASAALFEMEEGPVRYLTQVPGYLAVASLYLTILFAYFGLRLDRILTCLSIVFFELAIGVLGAISIYFMRHDELDTVVTNEVINLEMGLGLILAMIVSIAVFLYLKAENIFLVTERNVLEEDG